MKTNIMNNIKAIILGIIIVLGVQYVSATFGPWSAPPSSPPSNNVAAPINVGDFTQTKVAGITLDAANDEATLTTEKLIVTSPGTPAVAGQVLTAVNATGLVKWATPTGGSNIANPRFFVSFGINTPNNTGLLSVAGILDAGTYNFKGNLSSVNDGGGGFLGAFLSDSPTLNYSTASSVLISKYGVAVTGSNDSSYGLKQDNDDIIIIKRNGANDGSWAIDRNITISSRKYLYIISSQVKAGGFMSVY